MTIYMENETETAFDFDLQETAGIVAEKILELEACPYETVVNVLLTDNEGIRRFNRDFRGIIQIKPHKHTAGKSRKRNA